jgi:hypothetical protein
MSAFGVRPHRPTVPAFHFASLVFVLAILVSGSGILSPADAVAAASGGQVIHEGGFHPGDLRWEADPQGSTYPVLDGTRPLAEPGLPMLPVRELVLLVPLSVQVENLWVEPLETHRETFPNPLALAGPHVTDSGDMMTITRMNREDGEFPAAWGEFTGSHVWRGYRLATVSVYPVREFQTDQGV